MARQLSESELAAVSAAVLPHLQGWELIPREEGESRIWPKFRHGKTGALFSFHNSYKAPGMVTVSGSWPRQGSACYTSPHNWGALDRSIQVPEMRFSPERPPEKIAADIQRRFLEPKDSPSFLEIYEACVKCKLEQAATVERSDSEIKRLASILSARGGLKASYQQDTDPARSFYAQVPGGVGEGYVTVESTTGERFDLTINYASVEVAERLLQVLKDAGFRGLG